MRAVPRGSTDRQVTAFPPGNVSHIENTVLPWELNARCSASTVPHVNGKYQHPAVDGRSNPRYCSRRRTEWGSQNRRYPHYLHYTLNCLYTSLGW